VISHERNASHRRLDDPLRQRILLLDGATGTQIQTLGFGEAEFRGAQFAE
jgi:methionine synthase I (cobalamin-dependent)